MRKLLIVAAIMLSTSLSAYAKIYVTISVSVSDSDEKTKRELEEGMEARINSTERYAVSGKPVDAELLLDATCMILENGGGRKDGVVCDSEVTYFPFRGSALSIHLEGASHMAVSGPGNTAYIVGALMNRFINGTTDDVLTGRKNFLKLAVRQLCEDEPSDCKSHP
jgi:hypothetical protein